MKKWFLLLPALLGAASYEAPWLGNPYELEGEVSAAYVFYNRIGSLPYHDHQGLLHGSLEASLTEWQFLVAMDAAKTRAEDFSLTAGSFLARYNITDDIPGYYPVSFTVALKGEFPLKKAIDDPGLLYSSYCQGELQASLGKEWSCGPYWQWHLWCMGAFGAGAQFSPWIRGKIGVERNFYDRHRLGLFVEGREGLGHSPFPALADFQGYGPIAYGLVDLTLGYEYHMGYIGTIAVGYTARVAASRCPTNRQAIQVTINIPFSVL